MILELTKKLKLPTVPAIPTHSDILELGIRAKAAGHQFHTDGKSVQGRNLFCFVIGKGKTVVGVAAGAHSDEPPGIATAFYLIENLVSNPAFDELKRNFTFIIFPMLDPDGTALNFEWTKEPSFNFQSYMLHNYRNNNPGNDCEHGIPILASQTARPELDFFKRHIDQFSGRIRYYVTLHTTHVLGGAIFVTKQDFTDKEFIRETQALCESFGLPMMDYQPRSDEGITYLDKGFLGAPYVSAMQKKYEKHPEILAMLKMPTYEYVETVCGGKITMISELPLWIDERLVDTSDAERTVAELKQEKLDFVKKSLPVMKAAIADLEGLGANPENPWLKNAKFALLMNEKTLVDQEEEIKQFVNVKATKADLVDAEKLPFEEQAKYHRLYVKCLSENQRHSELLTEHQKKFAEAVLGIESVSKLRLFDLRTQIQIQAGLIFQGLREEA